MELIIQPKRVVKGNREPQADALGQPRGTGWEGGGKQGTHVYLWPIHVDVWQKKKITIL